jgi:catechol 2,3-dioxygenase-like lactoylglutathione lyase family enzyme
MDIQRVDHYSIRTDDLERSRRFYIDVIGLEEGPRPPFDFPGYWLYGGEHALVHLIGIDAPMREQGNGTGAVDHVAFAATNRAALLERCRKLNVPCRERTVPRSGAHQVFLQDPDGVTIELNYRADEA